MADQLFTESTQDILADALAGAFGKVSLHTADPGLTGANEMVGVARATPTWAPADDGFALVVVNFDNVTGSVTHIGFWSADGLTFRGYLEETIILDVSTDVTLAIRLAFPSEAWAA